MLLENIRLALGTIHDLPALLEAGDKLFDFPVIEDSAKEFFADPRHHIALAHLNDRVIGMASAFHYVHPDKQAALFVNEVSVLEAFQHQHIGRALVKFIVEHGRNIGCNEIWVATEASNLAARKAYVAAGGKEDDEPVVLVTF